MFFLSLTISFILLLIVIGTAAWSKNGATPAAFIAGLFFSFAPLCSGVFILPAVAVHALTVVAAAYIWQSRGWRFQYLLPSLLIATVVAYGIVSAFAFSEVRSLQQRYPYESMEERLPTPHQQLATEASSPTNTWLLEYVEDDLEEKGARRAPRTTRSRALELLHEHVVDVFVSRQGFGVYRSFGGVSDFTLNWDVRTEDPIPQPGPRSTASQSAGYADSLAPGGFDWEMQDLHVANLRNFVNMPGFGFVKDRKHVAGFQSHRFRQPELYDSWKWNTASWKLNSLDLVGLLMHPEPVVYISDNLPRMDELREAPVRSLDAFEAQGLAKLQRGDDMYERGSPEGLRVLGAIRCAKQCVDCHGAQRGDLLGAFSYTFAKAEKASEQP